MPALSEGELPLINFFVCLWPGISPYHSLSCDDPRERFTSLCIEPFLDQTICHLFTPVTPEIDIKYFLSVTWIPSQVCFYTGTWWGKKGKEVVPEMRPNIDCVLFLGGPFCENCLAILKFSKDLFGKEVEGLQYQTGTELVTCNCLKIELIIKFWY